MLGDVGVGAGRPISDQTPPAMGSQGAAVLETTIAVFANEQSLAEVASHYMLFNGILTDCSSLITDQTQVPWLRVSLGVTVEVNNLKVHVFLEGNSTEPGWAFVRLVKLH